MELTPEERKRIYEEEKARLEAEEKARRDKRQAGGASTGLEPNVAALLCYLGMWISGIIFLVLEQKNKFVRFHAAQSIVVFGALTILSAVLRFVPVAGQFFNAAIGLLIFILWLVLMVKAYRGEFYRLPLAADLAERLLDAVGPAGVAATTTSKAGVEEVVTLKAGAPKPSSRTGEVIASSIAIALGVAALVFFNFFHEYIAYYYEVGGVWIRQPLLTSEYNTWLPVVTVAIVLSIIGHILVIMSDRPLVRETLLIIVDLFALIALGSLLSIFPFNFEPVPVSPEWLALGVRISLAIAMAVIGITMLVRLARLVVGIMRS